MQKMASTNMQEYIPYVSLHNNTTFSLMDSLIEPKELFQRAKELNQPAVAVTDHGTLSGIYESYKASKETGVKLIVGVNFYFVNDVNNKDERLRHLILLAKNKIGYQHLLKLSKLGFDNRLVSSKKVYPRIDWALLKDNSSDLICTTACGAGIISQLLNKRDFEEAEKQSLQLKEIFGDNLFFEVQPNALNRNVNLYTDYVDQMFTNRQLKKLGEKLGIKLIVATDAHYVTPDQYESHDAMLAMGSGQPIFSGNRLKYNVNDFYIKSGNEVKAFFSRVWGEEFAQSLINNTLEIADMCEDPSWTNPVVASGKNNQLPRFPIEDEPDYEYFLAWKYDNPVENISDDALFYRYRSFKCLDAKIKKGDIPEEDRQECIKQMEEEFEVFEFRGFSSYMLIVADFLNWGRSQNISIGYGRGSVGGSLTAYVNDIHAAYPKKFGLIFARFLNKFKDAYPDIDSDISPKGRGAIHNYLARKYGADRIAHVSNVLTMKPKVYAKSITRTFDLAGDRKESVVLGQKLADLISADTKKVTDAFERSPLLNEYAEKYKPLKNHAKNLQNKKMAWATHAAGIVLSIDPLQDYFPLRIDKEGQIAVEFTKDDAEANSLVKIDTLGLSTLDIITETERIIKECGKEVPIINLNEYDEATYNLISDGRNNCVFQLGTSGGTIDLCRRVKPKSIYDLALINALARPSAKDIRNDFIATRNGDVAVNIPKHFMDRAFSSTYGFGLFEESLMFLAEDAAGWNLHQADNLRKLTKMKGKDQKKVDEWRQDFIGGMKKKHDYSQEDGEIFWEKHIASFGGYGFNASHAIMYSMVGYHTAYLKAHFPLEFLVANLKSEVASNAKIAADNIMKIKEEIRFLNIKIIPPDINISEMDYKVIDNHTLMTGLSALKFVSDDAIQNILETRPYTSFEDFLAKTNSSKVRSTAIQALAASGCFDSIAHTLTRKQMYLYASDFKKKFQAYAKSKAKNPAKYPTFNYPWPEEAEWSIPEIFALEKRYLGEGLTGTKFDVFGKFFKPGDINFKKLDKIFPPPPDDMDESDLKKYSQRVDNLKGEIKQIFEFNVKKEDSKLFGQTMAKMLIEDPFGNQMRVTLFPDGLDGVKKKCLETSNKRQPLAVGIAVKLIGNLQYYEGTMGCIITDIRGLAMAPQEPSELKSRKIVMKKEKVIKQINLEDFDRNDILDDLEEDLAYGENGDIIDE